MNRTLLAQIARPLVGIFYFILRKALRLIVRISSAFENYFSRGDSDKEAQFYGPAYIRYLLKFFLPEKDREIVTGDLVQDYKYICTKVSKEKADQWLFEEMVESLQRLIFRRATLAHAWASFRRVFGIHALIGKLRKSQRNRERLIISSALGTLIVILLAPLVSTLRDATTPHAVKNETPYLGLQELSLNQESHLNHPSQDSKVVAASPSTTPPLKAPNKRKPTESNPPEVFLDDPSIPRGEDTDPSTLRGQDKVIKETKIWNKPIVFRLKLVEGSSKGVYEVSLIDSKSNTLLSTVRATSPDGKYLKVKLDMRKIPRTTYQLSVSGRVGSPTNYPINIDPK